MLNHHTTPKMMPCRPESMCHISYLPVGRLSTCQANSCRTSTPTFASDLGKYFSAKGEGHMSKYCQRAGPIDAIFAAKCGSMILLLEPRKVQRRMGGPFPYPGVPNCIFYDGIICSCCFLLLSPEIQALALSERRALLLSRESDIPVRREIRESDVPVRREMMLSPPPECEELVSQNGKGAFPVGKKRSEETSIPESMLGQCQRCVLVLPEIKVERTNVSDAPGETTEGKTEPVPPLQGSIPPRNKCWSRVVGGGCIGRGEALWKVEEVIWGSPHLVQTSQRCGELVAWGL